MMARLRGEIGGRLEQALAAPWLTAGIVLAIGAGFRLGGLHRLEIALLIGAAAVAGASLHRQESRVPAGMQIVGPRPSVVPVEAASDVPAQPVPGFSLIDLACELDQRIGDDVAQLALATRELELNSAVVTDSALAARENAEALKHAARLAADDAQKVARATEGLVQALRTVDERSRQSSEVADQAARNAQNTNLIISNLTGASQSISDILDAIGEIARQTNLLALNAAIEAARAGEAGRGFAVVATEVKALSTQTSKATQAARAQILAMQGASRDAVEAVAVIADSVCELNELATSVGAAISQQKGLTLDIAANVVRAADGFEEVAQRLTWLNDSNDHAAEAAGGAMQVARDVAKRAVGIQSAIGHFLLAPAPARQAG